MSLRTLPAPTDGTILEILRSRSKAISVDELAELLDVSKAYLYKHVTLGNIPAIRLPGTIRFDPRTIASWIEARG